MWPLLIGLGIVAAIALRPKHDPYALPPVLYDGKPVDTTPTNFKEGASAAELEAWATEQGFRKIDTLNVPEDLMKVVRAFEVNLFDARKAHDTPAIFATMVGNPFLAGVVDATRSNAYLLPP